MDINSEKSRVRLVNLPSGTPPPTDLPNKVIGRSPFRQGRVFTLVGYTTKAIEEQDNTGKWVAKLDGDGNPMYAAAFLIQFEGSASQDVLFPSMLWKEYTNVNSDQAVNGVVSNGGDFATQALALMENPTYVTYKQAIDAVCNAFRGRRIQITRTPLSIEGSRFAVSKIDFNFI